MGESGVNLSRSLTEWGLDALQRDGVEEEAGRILNAAFSKAKAEGGSVRLEQKDKDQVCRALGRVEERLTRYAETGGGWDPEAVRDKLAKVKTVRLHIQAGGGHTSQVRLR